MTMDGLAPSVEGAKSSAIEFFSRFITKGECLINAREFKREIFNVR